MDIQVLIEPVDGSGYRASALSLSAEGKTEEEAINQLKVAIIQRMAAGAIISHLWVTLLHWATRESVTMTRVQMGAGSVQA